MSRLVRAASIVAVTVAVLLSSFVGGAAHAAGAPPARSDRAAAAPEDLRLQREVEAALAAVLDAPRDGAAGAAEPVPAAARRGLGDVWRLAKCVAAVTVAVASTVLVAAKVAKIKKLVSAAGGIKRTAERVIKAFKATGSLTAKARAGFGDLSAGVVALAVVVLDIDTIKEQCG